MIDLQYKKLELQQQKNDMLKKLLRCVCLAARLLHQLNFSSAMFEVETLQVFMQTQCQQITCSLTVAGLWKQRLQRELIVLQLVLCCLSTQLVIYIGYLVVLTSPLRLPY